MPILSIKNLSYGYEGSKENILNNINIEFNKGKMYSIVGKSRQGKTTLISLIAGLDTCKSGEILYCDKDIKTIDRDEYRSKKIGVIFENYNLLTNSTALENVLLTMNISGVKEKDIKKKSYDLLERVGIDFDKANHKVIKLSGEEQQRVSIARVLSYNPKLIIVDEPTGNLDIETEKDIINIFKELVYKENKCIIILTHSKKISAYADEVWGLNKGNLLFIKE